MKLKEVISKLQDILEKEGDVEVGFEYEIDDGVDTRVDYHFLDKAEVKTYHWRDINFQFSDNENYDEFVRALIL